MAWSKSTRIKVMMALDTVFLITELFIGYYVDSLALIADAFHMVRSLPARTWAALSLLTLPCATLAERYHLSGRWTLGSDTGAEGNNG